MQKMASNLLKRPLLIFFSKNILHYLIFIFEKEYTSDYKSKKDIM